MSQNVFSDSWLAFWLRRRALLVADRFVIARLAVGAALARGRRDVAVQQSSDKALAGQISLPGHAGLARARAEILGAVRQRRLGLVRFTRRPDHDQPPYRRGLLVKAQYQGARLPGDRIRCEIKVGRGEVRRP